MNCPNCKTEINVDNISVTFTKFYETMEYLGLFGGEPETWLQEIGNEKTGKYNCPCGSILDIAYQGNTDDFVITGYKYAPKN